MDAILGASKQMHTVIAKECTGCALCLPPCPVDCIVMVAAQPAGHKVRVRPQPSLRTPAATAGAPRSQGIP